MANSWVGSGILPKMWERPFWEGVWPFFGPVGQCAPAHGVQTWRALFLPHSERAGGGFERGVAKSLSLCGSAQLVCTFWQHEAKLGPVVVNILTWETCGGMAVL